MRVLVSLMLVALVLQGTLAVTSKSSQNKLMIEKVNKSMEKSHLGRALKNMITLASKLGSNFDDFNNAIEILKSSLLSRKQNAVEVYTSVSANYENNVIITNLAIDTYIGQIADGESALFELNHNLDTANTDLTQNSNELTAASTNLDNAQTERSDLITNHTKDLSELADATDAINRAIRQLEESQTNYNTAQLGGFSFAELKNNVVVLAQKISDATVNLKASHQLFVKPVIQVMNQMKSTDDVSSIQTAISGLQDLSAYFDRVTKNSIAAYNSSLFGVDGRIENFQSTVILLSETVIPALNIKIEGFNAEITINETAVATAKSNKAEQEEALVNFETAFTKATERHKDIITEFDSEYVLVQQAQKIVSDALQNQEA